MLLAAQHRIGHQACGRAPSPGQIHSSGKVVDDLPAAVAEGCWTNAVRYMLPGRPMSTPQSGVAGLVTIALTSAVIRREGSLFSITVPLPV